MSTHEAMPRWGVSARCDISTTLPRMDRARACRSGTVGASQARDGALRRLTDCMSLMLWYSGLASGFSKRPPVRL